MGTALLGVLIGLLIGVACRVLNIPLPAPPRLPGALLVVAMTIGYVAAAAIFKSA
jgi:XapX domain-containing protein